MDLTANYKAEIATLQAELGDPNAPTAGSLYAKLAALREELKQATTRQFFAPQPLSRLDSSPSVGTVQWEDGGVQQRIDDLIAREINPRAGRINFLAAEIRRRADGAKALADLLEFMTGLRVCLPAADSQQEWCREIRLALRNAGQLT